MICNNCYIKNISLCLIFCFILSCHPTFAPPPKLSTAAKNEYIIGSGDVLQILVWKQPDISVTVPVRSDGKISIPLINDIQAAKRTPDQLRMEIAKKLEKFIEEPTVSVIVAAINSLKVTVSGNVNSPGVYNIVGENRLMEVITRAGGLSLTADPNRILLIRKQNGVEKYYQINYAAILDGEDIKQNIIIYPGDTIVVP
ncbi:MAG: polysaccharide biosynthesis/export family protein [Candidatus Hodarchaeota archaeon]